MRSLGVRDCVYTQHPVPTGHIRVSPRGAVRTRQLPQGSAASRDGVQQEWPRRAPRGRAVPVEQSSVPCGGTKVALTPGANERRASQMSQRGQKKSGLSRLLLPDHGSCLTLPGTVMMATCAPLEGHFRPLHSRGARGQGAGPPPAPAAGPGRVRLTASSCPHHEVPGHRASAAGGRREGGGGGEGGPDLLPRPRRLRPDPLHPLSKTWGLIGTALLRPPQPHLTTTSSPPGPEGAGNRQEGLQAPSMRGPRALGKSSAPGVRTHRPRAQAAGAHPDSGPKGRTLLPAPSRLSVWLDCPPRPGRREG